MIEPGGPRWLALLSDDELQREYDVRRAAADPAPLATESCLLEMVRRDSERFRKHLAAAWRKRRPGEAGELSLLTALRRASGKPDPLAIEILDGAPFTSEFPQAPSVRFRIRNVDGAKERLTLTRDGVDRGGRLTRIRASVSDLDGRELPVRRRCGLAVDRAEARVEVAHGHSWVEELCLGDFVEFAAPGEYEVRLGWHDRVAVADLERVDGYALSWSAPFRVRLAPPPLVVPRARVDELKREFAAIDPTKPAPLVAIPWHRDLEYDCDAASPADRLFRAGLEAVPALLELLEQRAQSPAARGLALAFLWNVTGMHDPTAGTHPAAVGSVRWLRHWPGVVADPAPDWEAPDRPERPISVTDQEVMRNRWQATRAFWSITVEGPSSKDP